MKISKKIIISSLSTALGVSLVGAISGTVAWYQYNTAVRTSLIGTSVAGTGMLEISGNGTDWKSALTTSDYTFAGGRVGTQIRPVTFYTSASYDEDDALPANAWKNPNFKKNWSDIANAGKYATVYEAATAQYDYIQYTIYLRAMTVDNVSGGLAQKAEGVYLTNFILNDVSPWAISSGMRVHLAIDADGNDTPEANILINKTNANVTTKLFGALNLDDEIDEADWVYSDGWGWEGATKNTVRYGATEDHTQTSKKIDSVKDSAMSGAALFNTPASGASKITVTIWLEGWDTSVGSKVIYKEKTPAAGVGEALEAGLFTRSGATYTAAEGNRVEGVVYYEKANEAAPMWSGLNTDGAQFQFGLEFSVKDNAFVD